MLDTGITEYQFAVRLFGTDLKTWLLTISLQDLGPRALGSIYYVLWPRDQFNKMQSCPKLYTNLEVFTMFMSVGPGHRPGVVHELGPTWPESGYNLMGLVVHAELTAHPQAITHPIYER